MQAARYLRHRQIDGLDQDAVSALRVIVVGAGAIGNEVVKNLTLLGAGQRDDGVIIIHDLDRVETHNLTRSVLLREADVGQNKADAVARHARALDPAVRIEPHHGNVFDALGLPAVTRADVVIGALDNFEARIRINQLCLMSGTPWVNAAIDSRYASVEVFPFAAAQQPACYECALPASVYERLAERRSCGGLLKSALAERIMPTTTITTSLAGALAVNQALLLTGCDTRMAGADAAAAIRLFGDSLLGTVSRSELAPAQLCPGCGSLPWRASLQHPVGTAPALLAALPPADRAGLRLQMSDAVIVSARCTRCGDEAAQGSLTGLRAAGVSDAVTVCARCGEPSVAVEIRSDFDADEFIAVFAGRPLPAGWVQVGDAVFPTEVATSIRNRP